MADLSFRILKPGDEGALKAFLAPRLDSSLFLYSNLLAAGLVDTGQRYAGTYAAAFEEEQIVAVAGHFWNRTVVLQAPIDIARLVHLAQETCGRPIKRFVGPDHQVLEAIEALELDSADLQMDEAENLYSLKLTDLRLPAILVDGRAVGRRIQAQDEGLVSDWRLAYYRELHLEEDSPELREIVRRGVADEIESGRTWILELDGQSVSCTSFNAQVRDEAVPDVVQVGGVYTPPQYRGRGYARAVVAASLLHARAEGFEKSVLFTGVENIPAQRAYSALGYEQIGSYRIATLRSGVVGR